MPRLRDRVLSAAALWIAALIVLNPGCGSDKETSPEPEPPKPLVSGTIDAGGGQLVHDNVVLTVPAGALGGATELAIYREDAGHPFGVTGAPVYRLTGLPSEFGAPMELRFRHGFDVGAGDTLTLFLGEEREGHEWGRGVSWEAAAGHDSSGWCVTALERGALGLGARSSADLRAAVAEDVEILEHTSGHFRIIYRKSEVRYEDAANALLTFESAYEATLLLGFQYEQPDKVFPLDIYVMEPVISIACHICGPHGKGHFEFRPDLIAPGVNLVPVVAHEVLHSAQTFYDPRPPEQWGTLNQERLWLDEATAAYIETFAHGGNDYYPLGMSDDSYVAPLYGLTGQPDLKTAAYGYGMASFIKYLIEESFAGQGTDRILELYEHFDAGGDVTDAIDAVVDPPVASWCVDLHRQLVEGQIYHEDPLGVVWSGWPIGAIMGCEFGATKRADVTVPDLGAGIAKFYLTGDNPDPLTSLSVRASVSAGARESEPLPLTVYGNPVEGLPVRLAAGADSLTVGNWPQVRAAYDEILVMVSRPHSTAAGHTGKVEIKVEARVVLDASAIDVTSLDGVDIEVRSDNMYNQSGPFPNDLIGIYSDVAWSGDGFYAYSAEDTFAIHVNPTTLELGDWYGRTRYLSIGGNVILRQLGGHALALDDWDENSLTYRVRGIGTCAVLTHVFQSNAGDFDEDPYRWLTGYTCRNGEALYDQSGVYIHLYRHR
jgi:hypothetical protein